MPVLPFGEFLPDLAAYKNPGVLLARNAYPSSSGYLPVRDLATTTTALTARPRGAIQARDENENAFQYAGDATKLYQNVAGTWTDRSKLGGYTTAADERWFFTPWKRKVLAVNFSDDPQQITMGGTAFSDLTTALKARYITVIRDFVVVANTNDPTDGLVPNRVRWSAFNDETDWTISATTLADKEDLKTSGVVQIFGGEFGVIFQRNGVTRQTFVGAPPVFQFDLVLPNISLIDPGAAAQIGDRVYFLTEQGFFELINGAQARPIGAEKVNKFVLDDLDRDNLGRMSTVADPESRRILWSYPGAGNVNGLPNRIAVYDSGLRRWSILDKDLELLWAGGGTGFTVETLDTLSTSIDTLPFSLDSTAYVGSAEKLAAFDKNFKSGFFDGDKLAARFETGDQEIHGGARTQLNAFRPVIDGGTVTAQVGTRNRQTDTISFGPSLTQSASGRFTCRENARYHRFRFDVSGDWNEAIGYQIERHEARKAGLRG